MNDYFPQKPYLSFGSVLKAAAELRKTFRVQTFVKRTAQAATLEFIFLQIYFMPIKCELIVNSDVEHLQQIYTGFSLLHQKGFLELKQTIPAEFLQNKRDANRWINYKFINTKAILNDKIVVYYDAHDWNWIDEEILREADFYFKRSYDENFVSQLNQKEKVFPLGFNYQVTSSERDIFQMRRAAFYAGKDKAKAAIKGFYKGEKGEAEHLGNLESYPNFAAPPKVLFMARAWSPDAIENKAQRGKVEQLNENRAECVRRLRKEFGERFFGGLARDDYAAKRFKDCLLPDENLSNKRKYLEILKSFPVCVATVGLNGSNGWKLGEYVAFSKAIVTEPLQFQVTGDFAAGKNYLEFTAPEELIESVARLFDDKDLRGAMMMNNYRYYQGYLKPDALVLNSLVTVFRHTDSL